MTSDLRIQGEVVVNSEQAEGALSRVGDKATQMAANMQQAGARAGKAVDQIGEIAKSQGDKFTRAESAIVASIKRVTLEAAKNQQALEKIGDIQFNIAAKGLDPAKFAGMLNVTRQVAEETRALSAAMNGVGTPALDKMGISAAQTAAALRGVPAQFTDIITSLQGGQAPLTVFLQQGGQLKDMFGGAGNAARALGGYVLGLVNPFTIAAAAVAGIAVAYNQGSKEAEAFNKTLIMTGNAAGTSADSLSDMARAIDATSNGITQSKAAEALNSIAASGDVASDKLQRYAQVAIEFERAGGGAADEVAKAFSSMAGDPLAAVEKLNKSTNFLTAEIYNQIKALEDEGRSTDAARVAQDAYASMLDQRIPKLKDNLGLLERGWMGVRDAAAEAWDSMLNVGRAQTLGSRLQAAEKLLADYENTLPGKRTTEQVAGVQAAGGVDGLRNQIAGLRELMETQRKADEQQRANNQSTQAAINLSKQASQFDTDLEKQRKAVAQATELYSKALAAGNLSESARAQLEKDYLKTVAGITAVKEKRATSTRKENKDLADQSRIFAELAGVSSTYYTDLAAAQAQRAKGNISEAQYVAYVEELIQKQPFAVALAKEEAKAQQTLSKANLDAAASREKYLTSLDAGLDKIRADTAAQIDATARLGLSKEAIAELDAAKLEMLATDLELQAIKAMDRNLDEQTYSALKQQAEAYRELAEAKKAGAAKEMALNLEKANQEAAREAARDWERAAADINRSLTDALLRGFESGKSFARNLRDTVKNMFSTLVLRPIISAVMTPVSGMVNGLVQGGMNAVGMGGSSNLMGMANTASSLNTLYGTASQALYGGVAGASAASLGYANAVGLVGGDAIGALAAANGMWAGVATGAQAAAQSAIAANLALEAGTAAALPAGTISTAAGGAAAGGGGISGALASIPGWGWALAGIGALYGGDIINGLFGRKLKDSGIEGDFGGASGFEGRQFEYYKGGLFRSDKTKYKDLDEETRAALADTFNAMRSGAKEMAGVLGLGTQAIDGFTAHVKVSLKGLSAEEADKRLKEEFDKVAESLASTTLGTQDYTRAGETALQTLTRLSGSLTGVNQVFENLGATLYASSLAGADMASQLVDLFGGMDGLSQTAGSYMQNYYSADEQRAAMQRQLQKAFDGLDLKLPDIDASDARAQFRALAEAQDLTTDAGRKTYASLLQLSGAFASITQSAEDAASAAKQLADEQERARQDSIRSASDLLKRAIDRDRDALQDQASGMQDVINALSASVSTLKNNARELYGQVDGTAQMLAAQGMVYIEQALGGVRAGGSITDYTGLTDAIGAARGGINSGAYASQFERERDALVLAGQLSELGELGDLQLSIEERQLKALTAQIDALDALGQRADDLINGTTALTGTVQSYFDQLLALLAPEKPEEAEKKTGGVFAIGGSATGGGGDGGTPYDKDAAVRYTVGAQLKYGADKGLSHDDPAVLKAINAAVYGTGITQADIAKAYGVPEDDIARLFAGVGLPKFDVGTNRVPRTGLAVVHEGEAIIPKAYNPWAGGGQAGGNAEMVAELRALREEVAQLRAASQATASSTAQMAEQLDQVTEGGNAMRTEVV